MSTTPRTLEDLTTTQRVQSSLPVGFDPAAHPVIARHIFGVEPFPIGPITAEVVADLRFRRQVQRLHRQGDRVLGEFLAEIGAERGIQTIIDRKIDIYTRLDPETLEVTGGDGFWPVPVRRV